ncbi:Bax inhibitor-1 family protein [Ureibacillus sp. FSL K6-3587]|uniref:Bax inhibitor-1 family protein n=1 Tax=Ureibacillus sp. FSL K6-3587 TaxID=2954681 RepID=UPI00315884F0
MYGHHLSLVLKHFALMWGLTAISLIVGMFLPSSIVIIVSVVNLVLLFIVVFTRNMLWANGILYLIPFFTGIMFYWLAQLFIGILGTAFVYSLLFGAAVLFITLALLGLKMPRHFPNGATYLTAILLVFMLFFIIYFFIPVDSMVRVFIAAIIVFGFVLYTVYDFNLIRNYYVKEDELVKTALSLYLDFINIFFFFFGCLYRGKRK